MKYFKITNEREIHFGFQYETGLNIDKLPFQKHGSCVPGELYFTTLEYIDQFYCYGIWLREVFLPIDNPDFKMVADHENKFRANMIIFGERHLLRDISTIIKYKLPYPEKLLDGLFTAESFL